MEENTSRTSGHETLPFHLTSSREIDNDNKEHSSAMRTFLSTCLTPLTPYMEELHAYVSHMDESGDFRHVTHAHLLRSG